MRVLATKFEPFPDSLFCRHDLHKKTTLQLHDWGQRRIAKWNKSGRRSQMPDVEIVNGAEPSVSFSIDIPRDPSSSLNVF